MRGLVAIFIALFVLLVGIGEALAQGIPQPPSGKPSAQDEAAAKKNFESGLKLYGESAYTEALVAFETSYKLGGRFTALKNIAQCHRNLKHFVEAHEAYEQLVTLHGPQLPAADKKSVEQALEELSVLTGTILVTVNESDANIELDGKSLGKSPMTKPKRTSVGSHRVKVTKSGFDPNEQDANIGSQEQKKLDVTLALEKTAGHLFVREQSGRDVHVFIDGEDKGPAPWEGDVAAGEHSVEAKGSRFAAEPRKIKVGPKERLEIAFDASPLMGRLRVTTLPASATISVDGRAVGTGAWEGEIAEGTHKIVASLSGQPDQTREVVIGRGQLVVQEIPVLAGALASTQEYRGLYGRLSLQLGIAAAGLPDNSVEKVTESREHFGIAPGASLRIGHSYGWLAAEAVGTFFFEHRQEEVNLASRAGGGHRYESDAVNWFLGVGPRVTSKTDVIRFTFGIAPGLMFRNFSPRSRNQTEGGGSDPDRFKQQPSQGQIDTDLSPAAGYTTFGLVSDAGVLFGSTPGAKFFLGVQAMIDFPPDDVIVGPDPIVQLPNEAYKAPGRGVFLTDGPQITIGPTLGVQFGH